MQKNAKQSSANLQLYRIRNMMRQGTKGQSMHACMQGTDFGDRKNMRKEHESAESECF